MEPRIITFCQSDLKGTSFAAFDDMRRKGELCDLKIKVENRSLSAHRLVLAAGIPYFRSLFTGRSADNEIITMSDLDPQALESLIDFAYTSRINVCSENVRSLLMTSQFLQLIQVQDVCVQFLSESLCAYNVAEVCTFAHILINVNLIKSCHRYMRNNFEEFSKSSDFLNLPLSDIKDIISQDDISVSGEKVIFEAVINWVKSSLPEREHELPELLCEVRMVYLSVDFLIKRVASDELVKASRPCISLIDEVKNYHLLPEETSLFQNVKLSPRMSGCINNVFYSVSEDSWTDSNCLRICIHLRDVINNTWENLAFFELEEKYTRICYGAAASEKIYVFTWETISMFHMKTLEWEVLECRHHSLRGSAPLSFGNRIYFFSSYGITNTFFEKVRCFDTEENIWMTEEAMKTGRYCAAAASLEDYIYVTGGSDPDHVLSIVEKYNPVECLWTEVSPMLLPRQQHGCTSMNAKIYVCGGTHKQMDYLCVCSSEVYDPLINKWSYISSTGYAKSDLSLVSLGDKLYAFEKFHESEIYDTKSDQWSSTFKTPTGFVRAFLGPAKSFSSQTFQLKSENGLTSG